MAVRMRDVAELAGVSVATVSYVLARRPDVVISQGTRDRVLSAAQRLNYRYNALGADLRRGRTPLVGVQIYSLGVQTLARMVGALEDRLREAGMQPFLCHVTDVNAEQSFYKECRNRRVCGLVLTVPPLSGSPRLLRELTEGGSLVISSESIPDLSVPFVSIDRRGAAETAARHLITLGHRRIAAVMGFNDQGDRDFTAGFRAAHEAAGAPFTPELLLDAEHQNSYYEAGERAVAYLRSLAHAPTAVVTTDDEVAIGVIRALQRRGLRVPDDIAVIGWDDIPAAAYADVPLTTLSHPAQEQGTRLAQLFLDGLEDPQRIAGHQTCLLLELVIRASCGAHVRQDTVVS